MRYTFTVVLAFCTSNLLLAQDTTRQSSEEFYNVPYKERNSGSFGKSTKLLSFAYGLPNILAVQNKESVYQDRSWLGPIIARAEFPIREEIGIAPQVAWYKVKFTDFVGGVDKASIFGFGTMGMYHFNKLIPTKKLDVYAGVGLQLAIGQVTWNVGRLRSSNLVTNGMIWQAGILGLVGVRYYVFPGLGLFAEVGHPTDCYFDFGITFKLK